MGQALHRLEQVELRQQLGDRGADQVLAARPRSPTCLASVAQ